MMGSIGINSDSFFIFKQKTAYEMRISDWSSDVCSSDLRQSPAAAVGQPSDAIVVGACGCAGVQCRAEAARFARPPGKKARTSCDVCRTGYKRPGERQGFEPARRDPGGAAKSRRSEEHTSELQSLMRLSYAVFCLHKTKANLYHQNK